MTPCAICHEPARWLHDGRPFCRSHLVGELIRTGRPGTAIPAPDVVERLDVEVLPVCADAAAEIRRLRARVAELEAGQAAAG